MRIGASMSPLKSESGILDLVHFHFPSYFNFNFGTES